MQRSRGLLLTGLRWPLLHSLPRRHQVSKLQNAQKLCGRCCCRSSSVHYSTDAGGGRRGGRRRILSLSRSDRSYFLRSAAASILERPRRPSVRPSDARARDGTAGILLTARGRRPFVGERNADGAGERARARFSVLR